MMQGRCSNLPDYCSKAKSAELIDMPTSTTLCPECNSPVLPASGKPPGPKLPPAVLAGIAGAVVVVGAVAAYFGGLFPSEKEPTDAHAPIAVAATTGAGTVLHISGSAEMGETLVPALAKAYLTSRKASDISQVMAPDAQGIMIVTVSGKIDGKPQAIAIHLTGDRAGLADLGAARADIAMRAVPISSTDTAAFPNLGDLSRAGFEHVIALDGSAVIVAPSNPLAGLDLEDLQAIFNGTTSNWQQLGMTGRGQIVIHARDGAAADEAVAATLGLAPASLTARNRRRHKSAAEVASAVAADPVGIAIVSQAVAGNAQLVEVGDTGSRQLLPSVTAIKREAYPLTKRLHLYNGRASKNPDVAGFIAFALSEAGQAVVRGAGYVDLTPSLVDRPAASTADCQLGNGWNGDPGEYCTLIEAARPFDVSFRFRTGSADLDSRALADIDRIVALVGRSPNTRLLLVGFADSRGSYTSNCALSEARANTVRDALVRSGVNNVATRGFCSALPVRGNEDASEWEKNRRVEAFAFPG